MSDGLGPLLAQPDRSMPTNILTGEHYEPNILEMRGACGGRYGMLWEPGNRMHGWIHQPGPDGQWVSVRMGFAHEIERAKFLVEVRAVLDGLPCRA